MDRTIAISAILFPIFVSGVLSILVTPIVITIAHRKKWFDDPNDARKIHSGAIPRLGGIAMFAAFMAAVGIAAINQALILESSSIALLAGAVISFVVGLTDDFRNLRARFKFGIQLLAAIAVAAAGYRFEYLPLPSGLLPLGVFSWLLTIVWIVGISNAINMIDGLDGLAGGISLIAAGSMGVLNLALGNLPSAIIAFCLAAAIVGFLFYNLPPARIFMGDSGSLFLGFCLAVIPLIGSQTHPRELGVLTAGTIIALPVFDVFAAILRRRRKGLGIMEPDREHLHHKLLDLGFNVRNILAMTYLVGLGLGLAALMAATGDNRQSLLILMAALLALGGLFITLHFAKRKLMKNGMGNGAGDK